MTSEGAEPRAIGAVVYNRYRILRIVGRGGLGTVYQVADIIYGAHTIFALKELADANPGARKQFELESRWLRELNHDSIPKVRESFEWDGRVYLVMDFVDGENLEQYLHRTNKPLPEAQALRWMLPVCDALYYLHTRTPPLLHRDVKPANIIVTPGGHPVLVDFGIAKAHLPGMNQTVTFVRKAGTEGYAPPEQYAANGMTGPWSDVYALGATLYQLLTGRVPRTAVDRITQSDQMPSPRDLVPTISPLTNQAVMRAMELKPATRYQSVIEFAGALTDSLRVLGGIGGVMSAVPIIPPNSIPMSGPSGVSGPSQVSGLVNSFPTPAFPTPAFPGPSFSPPPPPAPAPARPLPSLGEPLPDNLGSGRPMAQTSGAGPLLAARSPLSATPSAPGYPVNSPIPTSSPPAPMPPSLSGPQLAGARQTGQLPHNTGAPVIEERLAGPSNRVVIITGLAIIALLLVAGGAWYAFSNRTAIDRSTPRATAVGYFNAVQSEQYDTAWQFSASSRNNPGAKASFIQGLQADKQAYGKVQSVTVADVTLVNSSEAIVTLSVKRGSNLNDLNEMTYILDLTQYDGSTWLIATISSQ
jgi:serine/threonine protein kinase